MWQSVNDPQGKMRNAADNLIRAGSSTIILDNSNVRLQNKLYDYNHRNQGKMT